MPYAFARIGVQGKPSQAHAKESGASYPSFRPQVDWQKLTISKGTLAREPSVCWIQGFIFQAQAETGSFYWANKPKQRSGGWVEVGRAGSCYSWWFITLSTVHPQPSPPFLPLVVWVFSAVPLAVGGSLQCPLYTHSLPLIFASSRLGLFCSSPCSWWFITMSPVHPQPSPPPPIFASSRLVFSAVSLAVGGSLQCVLYTHSLPPMFASSRLFCFCSSPCSWWFTTMSLLWSFGFSAVPLAVGGSLQCPLYTHSPHRLPPPIFASSRLVVSAVPLAVGGSIPMSLVHPQPSPIFASSRLDFSAVPLAVGGSLQFSLYTHSLPPISASSRLVFSAVPLAVGGSLQCPLYTHSLPPIFASSCLVFSAVPLAVGGSLQCPLYTHPQPSPHFCL